MQHTGRQPDSASRRTVHIPPAASTVTGDHKEQLRFTVTMGFGLANSEWLLRRRIERVKESLLWGHKLSEVALACGFADESHLARMLRRVVGQLQANGEQEKVWCPTSEQQLFLYPFCAAG